MISKIFNPNFQDFVWENAGFEEDNSDVLYKCHTWETAEIGFLTSVSVRCDENGWFVLYADNEIPSNIRFKNIDDAKNFAYNQVLTKIMSTMDYHHPSIPGVSHVKIFRSNGIFSVAEGDLLFNELRTKDGYGLYSYLSHAFNAVFKKRDYCGCNFIDVDVDDNDNDACYVIDDPSRSGSAYDIYPGLMLEWYRTDLGELVSESITENEGDENEDDEDDENEDKGKKFYEISGKSVYLTDCIGMGDFLFNADSEAEAMIACWEHYIKNNQGD